MNNLDAGSLFTDDTQSIINYLNVCYNRHRHDPKKLMTINEKAQWLKVWDATPIKSDLTDKLKFKDFIKKELGDTYAMPVLAIFNHIDDIKFDGLPIPCMFKCNHDCGSSIKYDGHNQSKSWTISDTFGKRAIIIVWHIRNLKSYIILELPQRFL